MGDRNLREDIFHYVEKLANKNELLLMLMGALTLLAGINALLLLSRANIGSVPVLMLATLSLPLVYRYWVKNYRRMAQFTLTVSNDYLIPSVGVAPLRSIDAFQVVPRSALREPDRPAPHSLVAEIREMGMAFPGLAKQLAACESVRPVLTYHDVANLLLIQEGLRCAQNPQYSLKIAAPGSPQKQLKA